jgi:solute carrier family 26 (sodium-independent sulfate anion transporter), member 11
VGLIVPELPAIVIILVVEHIAIAKAMGRSFNYTITPSQGTFCITFLDFHCDY